MLWLLLLLSISGHASTRDARPPVNFRYSEIPCETLLHNEFGNEPNDAEGGLITTNVALTADNLIEAYWRGIFPWGMAERTELKAEWFSPPWRGVLELNKVKISERDMQFIRNHFNKGGYEITFDRDFETVIRKCAEQERKTKNERTGDLEDSENWISPDFIKAYTELHRRGFAHSVEVWRDGKLVAGLYGVFVGGLFSGESMFHDKELGKNATKLALYALIERLRTNGHEFIDTQMAVGLTGKWGARYTPRTEYRRRMDSAHALNLPY
jgi:leucyl/phenylalanyl-tRNA--protein transferase